MRGISSETKLDKRRDLRVPLNHMTTHTLILEIEVKTRQKKIALSNSKSAAHMCNWVELGNHSEPQLQPDTANVHDHDDNIMMMICSVAPLTIQSIDASAASRQLLLIYGANSIVLQVGTFICLLASQSRRQNERKNKNKAKDQSRSKLIVCVCFFILFLINVVI